MVKLTDLRLKKHKGLIAAELLHLGKINVICGPNNSGKTTVLECIADEKLFSFGKTLDEEALVRINTSSMTDKYWRNEEHAKMYPLVLAQASRERTAWFKGESKYFWETTLKLWRQSGGSMPGEPGDLMNAYDGEFKQIPSRVLIPSKRRIDTTQPVQAFETISPDGRGILNFLFKAKNQSDSLPLRKHYDAICKAFIEITTGYEFDIFIQTKTTGISPPPTYIELMFRKKNGNWIQAADCGMGLQDLLIVLYFSIAAEHEVILVEEPENHLHPEIQRRLISFLRENTDKQFFISTHSSVFLNTLFADRVFTCKMTESVRVANATSHAALLTELGYSIADNLVSDLVVLCEGPKDKLVLEEFFSKMGLPSKSNIKIWPLGGDIMGQLDLTVFKESHQLIALVDNDPGSAHIRKKFLEKCKELKIPAIQLQRYAIENYFTLTAISRVMKGQMPDGVTTIAPNKRISDQLGFEVKSNGGKVAREMTLEDIKGTDFEGFLKQVENLATQNHAKATA